jgi:uncharacterized protein YegL
MDDKYLRRHREELNASSAVVTPICIVVDTSHSMVDGRFVDSQGRTRMERLNDGIQQFLDEIKKDDVLADSVEIAIVTFNTVSGTALAFSTIDNIRGVQIEGSSEAGDTPKGVETALQLLEQEKGFLKSSGKKYNQPWIVIMSDGRATPGKDSIDPVTRKKDYTEINNRLRIVQNKTKAMESNGKLTVIPVLISETTDGQYGLAKKQMQGYTNSNRCKEIADGESQVSFRDSFKILSRSVSVSNADLLFADAPVASGVRHQDRRPARRDDYISQDEVARMIRREPVQTETVIKPTEIKNEDLDEVDRLRSEALRTPTVADDSLEDDYEREVEDLTVTPPPPDSRITSKPISTVTKSKTTDDSYLESLLAGLDDWDNI